MLQHTRTETTLVIVSDQPDLSENLAVLLTRQGYIVHQLRTSHQQAVLDIQAIRPALILTDILGPDVTGYAVCQQIKASQSTREIPVIFLLDPAETRDTNRLFDVGGADYITLPVRSKEALSRIEHHIELRRARQCVEKQAQQIRQEQREREETEQRLIQERNLLHSLIDNMPDYIYVKDTESHFILGNEYVAHLMGTTPDTLVGKTDFDFYPPGLAQAFYDDEQRVIESGQPMVNKEEPNLDSATGIENWVLTTKVPFRDSQGQIAGVVGIGRNITERKQAQETLKHAKEAAETANLAKSEFLANMSHELRTPLNGILGYAQILKRDQNLTKKQREELEIIQRSGEHLLLMINDILDLSKIEAQKMELEPLDFSLPEVLATIVEIARVRAQHKGIALLYDVPPDVPEGIHSDEKRLRQILLNLLSNAIKFTETGSVRFSVTLKSRHTFSTPHLTTVRFHVEDTGVGIPPEHLEKIFDAFHQVKNQRLHVEGTGLGLAISQRLVRLMGSELCVMSTLDEGSAFWFDVTFPETSIAPFRRGDVEPLPIIGYKGKTRRILIVDDQSLNRQVLRDVLMPLGFQVFEAINGQEALTMALDLHPEMILMDLAMPVMNGYEATRHIRRRRECQECRIIAVSASAFPVTHQKSLDAGCHDFLIEPFHLHDLLECIRKHLRLEWKYQLGSRREPLGQPAIPVNAPIVPPAMHDIRALYDLVLIGDITRFQHYLDQLVTHDKTFGPFADHISPLVRELRLEDVQTFLEQFLDE